MAGEQYVFLDKKGRERIGSITSVTDKFVEGASKRADQDLFCEWKIKRNTFAPTSEWKNCGGSSGTQTSKRLGDSIFPLQVGSTESWEYSGTNSNGDSWSSTRNCEVLGTASLTVPAGTFDTYQVRCDDRWWIRDWFVRADGVTVVSTRTRKAGSQDRNTKRELVSYTEVSS
ncbi:MAG: hypothetical protein AAGD13_11245 [Pseudomonadota bacterium]